MLDQLVTGRTAVFAPYRSARKPMPDLLTLIATDRSEAAFRRLFEAFGPRIKSYMMRRGADAATAEELVQETLLTVWRKAGLYSAEKGSPAAWIFTIARNLRLDRLRREASWPLLAAEQATAIASDEPDPEEVTSERERQERVRASLAALPEEQREIVVLAFIEGLSHSEIAARLHLPLGTVKSRMRLAYNKVRASLEDLQ